MRLAIHSCPLSQDADVARVRLHARVIARSLACDQRDQIRFATAVSEVARNSQQYAGEGLAQFSLDLKPDGGRTLTVAISDTGPGIPDLTALLRASADQLSEEARGLAGARALVDRFDLASGPNGTVVTLGIDGVGPEPAEILVERARTALAQAGDANPLEELADQNRALRDGLAEKEFLLRELHHRVKNNLAVMLSLARLQARWADGPEATAALDAYANRIYAFSIAHNHLYQSEKVHSLDLAAHLRDLTANLQSSVGRRRAEIRCSVTPAELQADLAIELGLIVNELVSNACLHGFAPGAIGRVEVEARVDGRCLSLSVSDDGCGLADPDQLDDRGGLGWRLIRASAAKIEAELTVENGSGLAVRLQVPLVPRRAPAMGGGGTVLTSPRSSER